MVTEEGTIQGLLHACAGKTCIPGEEDIVALMEEHYVLVVGKDKYYYLPNVKSSILSPHLNKIVRVKGALAMGGDAVVVHTAEVMEWGKWYPFFSPEILKKAEQFTEGDGIIEDAAHLPPMTAEPRTTDEGYLEIKKEYPIEELAAKLRKLADGLESGGLLEMEIAGHPVRIPTDAEILVEYERGEGEEEFEIQIKWSHD
jgi:amphi-Trp domain-containing protein